MKQIIIFLFFLLSSSFFLTGCDLFGKTQNPSVDTPQESGTSAIDSQTSASTQEKIAQLRKRYNVKEMIERGDYYLTQNQAQKALEAYVTSYDELGKKDSVVAQKIAHAFFMGHEYARSFDFYIESYLPGTPLPREALLALLYTFPQKKDIPAKFNWNMLEKKHAEEGNLSYTCREATLDSCKGYIQEYVGDSALFADMKKIRVDFESLKTGDILHENALIAGVFFSHRDYTTSALIARNILKERPDYLSAQKIEGLSYYHLGQWDGAKRKLLAVFEKTPHDGSISALLGIIATQQGNWEEAIGFLNSAITLKYSPKIELERSLAYAYYRSNQTANMYQVLGYLLQEKEAVENDFIIASFLAWENNEYTKALEWAKKGTQKFQKSATLLALQARIYNSIDSDRGAKISLTRALALDSGSPLANFEMAFYWAKRGDINKTKEYLEILSLHDGAGVFHDEAVALLEEIEKNN